MPFQSRCRCAEDAKERAYQYLGDLTREERTEAMAYYAAGMLADDKYGPSCYQMTKYDWAVLWKFFKWDIFGHLGLDETEGQKRRIQKCKDDTAKDPAECRREYDLEWRRRGPWRR